MNKNGISLPFNNGDGGDFSDPPENLLTKADGRKLVNLRDDLKSYFQILSKFIQQVKPLIHPETKNLNTLFFWIKLEWTMVLSSMDKENSLVEFHQFKETFSDYLKHLENSQEMEINLEKARMEADNTEFSWLRGPGIIQRDLAELEMDLECMEMTAREFLNEGLSQGPEKVRAKLGLFRSELERSRYIEGRNYIQNRESLNTVLSLEESEKWTEGHDSKLRDLFKILHPDLLQSHPAYPNLTDEQKRFLESSLHDLISMKNEIRISNPEDIRFNLVRIEVLDSLKGEILEILEKAGMDPLECFLIQGSSLEEKRKGLLKRISGMGVKIGEGHSELYRILTNKTLIQKKRVLR